MFDFHFTTMTKDDDNDTTITRGNEENINIDKMHCISPQFSLPKKSDLKRVIFTMF